MIEVLAFYAVSAVLIGSAIMVVTQRRLFNSALFLAVALSMVACYFVLLGADFLAAVQVLLYVGGILVILAFAVMLSSMQLAMTEPQINEQWLSSLLVCAVVLLVLLIGINKTPFEISQLIHRPTTDSIGKMLLGDMALPFELVSLVLLASLVGAVIFTKKAAPGEAPPQ